VGFNITVFAHTQHPTTLVVDDCSDIVALAQGFFFGFGFRILIAAAAASQAARVSN
jgi:hypothetical protein